MLVRKKTVDRLMKTLNIVILGVFLLQPAGGPGLYFALATDSLESEPVLQEETVKDDVDDSVSPDTEHGTEEENDPAPSDAGQVTDDEESNGETETIEESEEPTEEESDDESESDEDVTPTSDESLDNDSDADEETCADDWEEKDREYTRCVEEGIEYELDINKEDNLDALKIIFTKIDEEKNKDNEKEITVKEIKLTDEQVAKLGALSNIAYDITSTMENGSFEYDLVLPVAEDVVVDKKDISVVYIEDEKDLKKLEQSDAKDVTQDKDVKVNVDDEITVENLDHFTLFVPMCVSSKKVEICHRTNAHNNPYGPKKQKVSVASIFGHNGHDSHNGPVWFSGIDEKWGDIIPPFDYWGGHYDGKNWNSEGQEIWENNCNVPGSITIIKDAQPDDEQEFEFEGVTGTGEMTEFTLVDDGSQTNNSKIFSSLPKNTYTIVED
ncbi:MAG: hypothetical protein U9Q12_01295, partial [Patescibacteria group bacterium]|nr:hypothetical protein [Patescibacteria group bacterium]